MSLPNVGLQANISVDMAAAAQSRATSAAVARRRGAELGGARRREAVRQASRAARQASRAARQARRREAVQGELSEMAMGTGGPI